MERRNRNTLKSYFRKGDVPTEEQFAELIDSVPNIVEDGQAVCTQEGWAFHPKAGGKMRVTLHEAEEKTAVWTLALTPGKGLAINNEAGETLLELKQDRRIVLKALIEKEEGGDGPERDPENYRTEEADKQWKDLIEITDGKDTSHVYTVIAIYRDSNLGTCRLTRATAICLNPIEQWVESPRRHWWGWSGRIRLRWQTDGGRSVLQIRSTRNSRSGKIYCRVTELFRK